MKQSQLVEHAKEQEFRVRACISSMAESITELDVVHENGCCTSAFIDYDEQDVFNVLKIFYSVSGNYAIKHGFLTPDNCTEKISAFVKMVKDVFGIDTVQESQVSRIIEQTKDCFGGVK